MEISDPGSRWGRGRDPNLRKGKEVKSSASGKDRTPPFPPKLQEGEEQPAPTEK